MPKYRVWWSKAYYACGHVTIEAENAREAENIVFEDIGDYTAPLQYAPDDNMVEVEEELEE